jgi:hypothetical protein
LGWLFRGDLTFRSVSPAGQAGHEQRPVLRTPHRLEQRQQLLGIEHHGQGPVLAFGKWNVFDLPQAM